MRAFESAIAGKDTISIIAEIKRRSPSFGDFPRHEVHALVQAYERGGAGALSAVTEPTIFGGSLNLLKEMRKITSLPILRKDFITTTAQLDESRDAGADAVLLIAGSLNCAELIALIGHAHNCGLDTVVEIHSSEDYEKIKGVTNIIIGINNRNLKTFSTDVGHALNLIKKIPREATIIAESGFSRPRELERYKGKVDAVLIGTAFLTSQNPHETLTSFSHAGRS